MSSGYTRNPAVGDFRATINRRGGSRSRIAKSEPAGDNSSLQFVTTTSTVAIDESSKRAIRKHASRYGYREKPGASQSGTSTPKTTRKPPSAATGGQIHRFRLGPQGLKHTPNQPPQVSKNFTILSLKSEELPSDPVPQASTSIGGVPYFGPEFSQSKGKVFEVDEEDEPGEDSFTRIGFGQSGKFSGEQGSVELVRWAREQKQTWLESLLFSRGTSLFGPSSGLMDPFNAMSLSVTPREQILLRHYFMDHRQYSAPLIPYCQSWFGLACQDKAYFHAVLSHYSATHRMTFQHESPAESINHLTTAIHIITERLQDPAQNCSNGTIGAVASLIIYESANGALASIEFHMRGLKEMVRRRGGFEKADFPMDLKRLIAWTDLNTANDLWQKPRFPALKFPASPEAAKFSFPESFALPGSSNFDLTSLPYPFPPQSQSLPFPSTSLTQASQPNIDTLLEEMKAFAQELTLIRARLNPLNRPSITTADRIHALERRIFDLIHSLPPSTTALDHACAVAALIYMRSNVRDYVCNFRLIDVSKLKEALMGLGRDLGELGDWTLREREKLVWTVGIGAVSAAGREERDWFVGMFGHVCQSLGLRRWEYVRAVFETVLWKGGLDSEGLRVWAEMGTEVMI